MAARGVSALVPSFILAQAFSYRIGARATLPPPTASDPGKSLISHGFTLSPRRPGPVRRAVALVTAAVFAVLPSLQTVFAADDGQRSSVNQGPRRQLANVDPSLTRLPTRLAAPHSQTLTKGVASKIAHDGAVLDIPAGALTADTTLSITPLGLDDLAAPDPGLSIATLGPRAGYRMGPPGQRFARPITVTLPYDRARLPKGQTDTNVGVFWYDADAKHWVALEKVAVDPAAQTVTARTDHFTDFIAGTVVVPDHPQVASFNPNQIADLKAADPGAKINLIEPPQVNASGDARGSYPIELPAGRNGMQPQLALTYNSAGGNGWVGLGWDLAIPSVEIDTRWGVPRYDTGQIDGTPRETETYLLSGEQLAPVAHRGDLKPRTAERSFSLRVEGQFVRIVRHGDAPHNYFWEVTDKEGTRHFYGGTAETGFDSAAVLADPRPGGPANIGRWLLRQVVDPDGNTIRYNYKLESDALNGPEPTRQIYLDSIRYTGRAGGEPGLYEVSFIRTKGRPDPIIDGRLGFKTVTVDRLTSIEVKLLSESNPLVRRYQLDYQTGQFAKSLVSKIRQFGEDGSEFNAHELTYFDEVGTPDPTTISAFAPGAVSISGATTVTGKGLVSGVRSTAFSADLGRSDQVSSYIGLSPDPGKDNSAGFRIGGEDGTNVLDLVLADLNGDGRLDQVFEVSGAIQWRANVGTVTAPEFGPAQPVAGLGSINEVNEETTSAVTAGVEGFAAGINGLADIRRSRTRNRLYLTDVNGDGLADFVTPGGGVLFNRLDAAGTPSFAADSPTPLGTGAPANTDGLITVSQEEQDALAGDLRRLDSLRRWVAPFAGTIDITGEVALTKAGPATADGVRATVQLEDTEVFSVVIADPTDLTPKPITGLTGIAVKAGDRLYFRVNSRTDGTFDTVAFDPTVTYTHVDGAPVDPARLDENNLPLFIYRASSDFAFGDRPLTFLAPVTGTATIAGTLSKPNVTSDAVTIRVFHKGAEVFAQEVAAGTTGDVPIAVPARDLTRGDSLLIRIDADTRINLAGIRFAPRLAYTIVDGQPAPTNPDGSSQVVLDAPVSAQVYPVVGFPTPLVPLEPWIAPGGSVEVTQIVSGSGTAGFNSRITLAARSGGTLLAKQRIEIVNGAFKDGIDRLKAVLDLPAGTPVFFTADATNPGTLGAFTIGAPMTGSGEPPLPFEVRLAAPDTEPFGGGHRGWSFGEYDGRAGEQPIDQTLLRQPQNNAEAERRAFSAMLPFPNEDRWRLASRDAFIAAGQMGATHIGSGIVGVTGAGFGGARGVVRTGGSRQAAVNISVSVFGAGVTQGEAWSDIDFLDFNGDGYPDVVGGRGLQATLPNGALGAKRIDLGAFERVRESSTLALNANLGATISHILTGADGQTLGMATDHAAFNIGVGVSAGTGEVDARFDLVDINGDGLPDHVRPSGGGLEVRLNLGYRFGAPEQWGGLGTLRFEKTGNIGASANVGIAPAGSTDPEYGFGGGISAIDSRAATERDLIDVNGDGLPDLVFKPVSILIESDSPNLEVHLNTGAGFLPPQTFTGLLKEPVQKRSTISGNLGFHFTISIPLSLGGPFLIINPGYNGGDQLGRAETHVRDFDGDGYPDHLFSDTSGNVRASLNRHGRTNLLQKIRRPLGAEIALDYERAGNTPEHPQRRWVLASRTVFDGFDGDGAVHTDADRQGADFQIATFTYEDGRWDRAERTFYGFRTVREQHRKTEGVTKDQIDKGTKRPADLGVHRSFVQTFRTDSFYTKMLLERQVTEDGAAAPFLETAQTYNVVDVPNNTAVPGLEDFTATRFPQLTRRDRRFFEGQPAPGKQTAETFVYDAFGNVTVYTDLGDDGPEDDVVASVRYTGSDGGDPACQTTYIVGMADRIRVADAAGTELRRRESDVSCATANPTQVRRFLADGSAAVTDMTHDDHGRLTRVVGPANAAGERTTLDYVYDTTVGVHVISVTDQFGHTSTATYNFKFAEVLTSTDRNNQTVTNTYDVFGRLATVVGPYEQGTGRITLAFQYNPHAALPWALTRHIDTFRSLSDPIETALFIDGLKRVVQTKKDGTVADQAGNTPVDKMVVSGRVVFDPFGRTIRQFYPVTEDLGLAGTFNTAFDGVQPTRTTFDILDRVTSVQIPDNTTTATSYDFAPDRAGRTQFRTTVIDGLGVRKEMFRDVRGLITTVSEFNNGGAQVLRTSYAYDPLKQITTITDDRNNLTRVAYDTFGRRTAIDSPDAGRTAFVYDLADNLTAKETANLRATGQQISYAYEFTRLKAISYPVFPENNVTYAYGPASLKGQPGNRVGRITKITDAAGTEERLYGPLGETVEEKRIIPLPGGQLRTYVTRYQFDTFNRLQVLTYPDNDTVVTYAYDSGGLVRLVSGTDSNSSDVYAPRVDYDKFGQRLLVDFGNGARTTYAYDDKTRRITSVKASLPNGYTFHDLAFSYDAVGNLTQLQNKAIQPGDFPGPGLGNAIGGPWTKDYAYDQLYRMTTSAGQHQTNPNEVSTYSYDQTYDTIHNITRKNQSHEFKSSTQPDTTYDYTFTYPTSGSARPHGAVAIGPYDILHDANGNLTRQTRIGTSDIVHYVYDEENRLACVHKGTQVPPNPSCNEQGVAPLEIIYDHAGVRKRKDSSQPTFYPNQFLTDIGGGAGGQFKHIFLGATRILTMKVIPPPDKQQWYYHADHLGSTSIVTSENGQLAEHTHYFPYGEVWLQERPSTPVPYLFSSKEFDPETGLYDFGSRYLNPRFALWMSTDPALGDYLPSAGHSVTYIYPSLGNGWRAYPDMPGMGGALTSANLALYGYGLQNPATLSDPDGGIVKLAVTGFKLIVKGGDIYSTVEGAVENVQTLANPNASTFDKVLAGGSLFLDLATGINVKDIKRGGDFINSLWRRGCSFSEETPIVTAEGLRRIGELKASDQVLARSETTGSTDFKPIRQLFKHRDPVQLRLTLEDPVTSTVETIVTTPDHPFHVPGRGFIDAAALEPGDPVSRAPSGELAQPLSTVSLTADLSDTSGALRVKALTLEHKPFWAYDLEVADHHTFFVGTARAWVHNCRLGGNYTPSHFRGFGDRFDDRLPVRSASGPTHGVIGSGNNSAFLGSGVEGPGKRWFDPKLPAVNQAATHVEGHAAALLIDSGARTMDVTINNRAGPCRNCLSQLPGRIPHGRTLNVIWWNEAGQRMVTPIVGRMR